MFDLSQHRKTVKDHAINYSYKFNDRNHVYYELDS